MAKKLKPARTEKEWWALLKSDDKTFVRSMADWKKVLKDPKRNPLKGCDPKAIDHFTKNLKFVNGGLGHADYGQVARQIDIFQFKKLWAIFGLSLELFSDHDGYECAGRGTCSFAYAKICTSNC